MSFFEAAKESVNARGMNIVHRYDTTTVHYVVVYYIANFSHRFNERLDIPSAALSLFLSLYLSLCFSLYIYISLSFSSRPSFSSCVYSRDSPFQNARIPTIQPHTVQRCYCCRCCRHCCPSVSLLCYRYCCYEYVDRVSERCCALSLSSLSLSLSVCSCTGCSNNVGK